MSDPHGGLPWTLSDVRAIFLTTAVGIGTLLVASWSASRTNNLSHQVNWTVVAIVGVIVIGVGNFFWLLAGRRAVALRRARLFAGIENDDWLLALAPAIAPSQKEPSSSYVAVSGSTRYHRPACLVVQRKPVERISERDLKGRRPCEMCLP